MRAEKLIKLFLLTVTLLLTGMISTALAKPITAEQAKTAVQTWRRMEATPLKASLGKSIGKVQTFSDTAGSALYHVVYLEPAGFIIVPADDRIEPIIAFSSEGTYEASDTNPLGALVSRDLPGRMTRIRKQDANQETVTTTSPKQMSAQQKWDTLLTTTSELEYGIATVSDMRVAPLVQSKWNQSTVNSSNCYNYYTPNNYVTGCVATALSQLMRFHQAPTTSVGTATYTITVDSTSRSEALMGGNGTGGAYDWASMTLVPASGVTTAQCQAIGRLMHDAGAAVNMSYTANSSGTDTLLSATALKSSFGYSNAVKGYNSGSNIATDARNAMVNPNLDAGLPVLFGITDGSSGHAIVGDGYGYQSNTMYHHLNMGWSGSNDLWYNLPNIDDSYYGFNSVYKVIYNVFTSGTGEIISGRVTDCSGSPLGSVTVTASSGGTVRATTTTNSNGIYAFKGLSSATTYTIAASKNGYSFTSQTSTTGTSSDYASTTGNKWGVDFVPSQGCVYSNLSITKAGTGTGTVSSSPLGISCGSTCSSNFIQGSSVTLTAVSDANSIFSGWSGGGCTGNGTCVINLTNDTTVTATFTATTLGEALNIPGITVTTLDNAWFPEATTTHDTISAVQSGVIGNSQSSSMQFTVTGPGTLSFWWKVSSESSYDFLKFYIDGVVQGSGISGSVDWSQVSNINVPSGTHTLRWTYSKDDSTSVGSDAGWVDQIFMERTLEVAIEGAGSGTVTSNPSAISCSSGICATNYNLGTLVSLTATPSGASTFGSWSGCTSSAGTTCGVNMDNSKRITATFNAPNKVKIYNGASYLTIADAYLDANSGAIIQLAQDTFDVGGELQLDLEKAVTLSGGWYADFHGLTGLYSYLQGILTVASGSVTVENLVIK